MGATLLVGLGVGSSTLSLVVGGLTLGLWAITHQMLLVGTSRKLAKESRALESTHARPSVSEPVGIRSRARFTSNRPTVVYITTQHSSGVDVSLSGTTQVLAPSESEFDTTITVRGISVGEKTIGPINLTFSDPANLFTTTVQWDETVTLDVQPNRTQIHVGEGGKPLTAQYGAHDSEQRGGGVEPSEVREYEPGDQLSRIDWKATARLNEPHIREYELTETHETSVVVDHRSVMSTGPTGETKLDVLREVLLSIVDQASRFDDPVGLYAVGDLGVTATHYPAAGVEQYDRVRRTIRTLRPTEHEPEDAGEDVVAPADAQSVAARLDDGTALGSTLRPYLASKDDYVHRLRDRPLFRSTELAMSHATGQTRVALVSDDSNPIELYESVKFASQRARQVLVFLAPTVLYEAGDVDEVDETYDRYRAFEEFRQRLARFENVSAFEVAPSDRLDAVINRNPGVAGSTARRRQRHAASGGRPATEVQTTNVAGGSDHRVNGAQQLVGGEHADE